LPPDAIFELKIHQNVFVAEDLPRTPLRELTALPRPPSSWRERGSLPPPQNPTPALGHAGLKFLALGLKQVVHP